MRQWWAGRPAECALQEGDGLSTRVHDQIALCPVSMRARCVLHFAKSWQI